MAESSRAPYIVGRGTKFHIAMLPKGIDYEPVSFNFTIASATPGTPIAPSAVPTSIPLSAALPTDVYVPAGSYIQLKHPTNGLEYMLQLASDALAGQTSISVTNIPDSIPDASTGEYPLKLRYRNNADVSRQGNRETAVDFESDGYERGLTTSISSGMSCNGYWSPLDAGYATLENAFLNFFYIYMWLELPKPRSTYTKGRIYKGVGSVTDLPLNIPAGGIIQANVSLSFEGKPVIVSAL